MIKFKILDLLFLYFILIIHSDTKSQSLFPFNFWDFNGEETGKDDIKKQELNTSYYQCGYDVVKENFGKSANLNNSNCLVVTGVMKSNVKDEFSIEFLFKGADLTFLTFSAQSLIVRFGYNGFLFRTTTQSAQEKSITDDLVVELKGAEKKSYNYYTDDNWHHLVFTASLRTGKKEIWVDGECPEDFSKLIDKAEKFIFGSSDGFRNTDQIDELAFYNVALPAVFIKQHHTEISSGKSYSFNINSNIKPLPALKKSGSEKSEYDVLEFAPGHPDYNIQATDQLKAFPLPRFNSHYPQKRNMSWMDITYLHRELPNKGGKGFGKASPQKAVEMTEEMAKYWNYYVDIPVLRMPADAAQQQYRDTNTVAGALVDFANSHPQYPVASILIQEQVRPVHAGFESSRAYVTAQDLSSDYYLKDEKNNPVISEKRKWSSPLMPLDAIGKDGATSRYYLNQLLQNLSQPPTLINENGEVFGHIRKEALLIQDPVVWQDYKKSGLTESQYSGRFQYRIDSVYRAVVMKGLDPVKTHFSFYNVSAFNPTYWPDYAMRRELNRWDKETVYSTPDFYPRWPDNWQNARGAFNGYGTVAAGRATEIALGDRSFSPFVSAGWGEEESNIRPAQWLALLKAMVMMGADFFYTGYFNVTGSGGKWPNGVGPNDPRGYAYQIAMPAYAQAIRTWAPEFFEKGILLNPADSNDLIRQFRFKGKAENELILVRKLDKEYLIYGSIQPNSNIKGNTPLVKQTTINLEGKSVTFEIRKQGSMYVLDQSDDKPVFYQLDGWHQYEHPWYWRKTILAEAELYTENKGDVEILTENFSEGLKFSSYNTFCRLKKGSELIFSISPLSKKLIVTIRARSLKGNQQLKIYIGAEEISKSICIKSDDWKEYKIICNQEGLQNILSISSTGQAVDIDYITVENLE